eukprot:3663327-Rhodomonas_salina.2
MRCPVPILHMLIVLFATACPVVTYRMVLRPRDAMSGTDLAYAATRSSSQSTGQLTCLVAA